MSEFLDMINELANSASLEALEMVAKMRSRAIDRLSKKRSEKRLQIQELEKHISLIDAKLSGLRFDHYMAQRAIKEKTGGDE